jgi:hypothetical protein
MANLFLLNSIVDSNKKKSLNKMYNMLVCVLSSVWVRENPRTWFMLFSIGGPSYKYACPDTISSLVSSLAENKLGW